VGWSAARNISEAIGLIGGSPVIMTAAHEGKRAGLVACGLAIAARTPASLVVSVPSGHRLASLIRDGRCFGISVLSAGQRLLLKKVRAGAEGDFDPFDAMECRTLVSSCPLLSRASVVFDCEVIRHLDLEADHEIYVGKVLAAGVCASAEPGEDRSWNGAPAASGEQGEDSVQQPTVKDLGAEAERIFSASFDAGGLARALRDRD